MLTMWVLQTFIKVAFLKVKYITTVKQELLFLISSFRRVLYVVCFFLGNYPASGFYMPTFRNTLSVPSS